MHGWTRRSALVAALGLLAGCSVRDAACSLASRNTADTADGQGTVDPLAAGTTGPSGGGTFTITFLGDSLTAGIGLRTDDAYPTLVQKRFTTEGYRVDIVNASIIGQTTSDGVRQLDEVLEPDSRILVIALGSNDALRGIALDQTRQNLVTLIETARARNVAVLLAGMEPPINLGTDYQQAFRGIFVRLAGEYKDSISYLPSLLEGVLGNPALNQEDGVRPNAEGAKVIAQTMFAKLQVMVDGMGSPSGS